jgi:phage terminase large subunit
MPTIDLNKHKDKLFAKPYYDIRRAATRFVVVYGGAGSSKSYSAHQHELISLMSRRRNDTLVLRKHSVDNVMSTFKLFEDIISSWQCKHLFRFNRSSDNRRITFIQTGAALIFKGLDDVGKLKSIAGIQRIMIEEADQITEDDFKQINARVRGVDDIQIVLLLNPISESHWIKTQMVNPPKESKDGMQIEGRYNDRCTVLKFTYKDNKFLTAIDIENYESYKTIDENFYRVYVLGEWGIENKDGKFAWAFSSIKHVQPTKHNNELPTWATFDFNVDPLTCTIAQVYDDEKRIDFIECIKLENSDIWKMCERLLISYPDAIWQVTGDATGQNRQAISRDNLNYYHVIQQELGLHPRQLYVPTVNPQVQHNQLAVNYALQNWDIRIDGERCQPLIYDLTYVSMSPEKKIIKDRSSDDKYADFLDNFRYLINIVVGDEIRSKIKR